MSYQLHVASFNIASALQPNIQEINLLLKDFQIDFVGLQEVD
ncbi:MAG: endonuclease/exonuclease/phosphatase family protein [Erysipelotrichaceae bacterium]|nr:endonuclease/exonuclease/phosphatase family protein [Erysipelotrichaceae bacterium]